MYKRHPTTVATSKMNLNPIYVLQHNTLDVIVFFHTANDAHEALKALNEDNDDGWSITILPPAIFFDSGGAVIESLGAKMRQAQLDDSPKFKGLLESKGIRIMQAKDLQIGMKVWLEECDFIHCQGGCEQWCTVAKYHQEWDQWEVQPEKGPRRALSATYSKPLEVQV